MSYKGFLANHKKGSLSSVNADDILIVEKPKQQQDGFSGSYNDLSDKPTIPDISGKLDKTPAVQNFWSGTQAQYNAIGTKAATTVYFIHE